MLLWLNGPFGGGKTQTAHELCRRLPGSVVCDPEQVGFGLHRMLPRDLHGDFQDLVSWRQGVVEVLDLTLRERPGVVIAPMTVTEVRYHEETVGRLRELGHEVRHVTLLATRETTTHRLRARGLGMVTDNWALSRLDDCLSALTRQEFEKHVWTDDLSIPEVADHVARSANLTLRPNTDNRVVAYARRSWTALKHLRLP